MGYSGSPSKACLACRQRRIKVSNATTCLNTCPPNSRPNHQKCDLAKHARNQCLRAGKVCQDYRTEIDFLFRDETKAVARKAQRRKPKSTVDTSTPDVQPLSSRVMVCSTQASTVSDFTRSLMACRPPSPRLLSPAGSVEEQAICFFLST